MRFLHASAVLCTIACASPVSARPASTFSWGKAGVPLDAYARDAAECAATSRYVTTYIAPKTLRELDVLSSAQLLDTVMAIGGSAHFDAMGVVEAITKLRSADDIARRSNTFGARYVATVSFDVRDQLQAVLDKCLVERGYVHIRLTEPQAEALRALKQHSPQRTAYLHSIDSDAMLIAQQRVTAGG
jgi:hypothetical protein